LSALLWLFAQHAIPNRGCATRPFPRQRCAAVQRCRAGPPGNAQVLAPFLLRQEVYPAVCPPSSATSAVLRAPHPDVAAGALVPPFAAAAGYVRSRFPNAYQVQLVAASAQVLRKIGATHAGRSHPPRCACVSRRTPPRTDRHQRAVTTNCRAGGVPFVSNMTNANSHRLAPSSGQFLVRGTGFCWQVGRLRRLISREARNAVFFAGAAMPTKGNAAHRFWQVRVCLQRLGHPAVAQRCGMHAWVLANAVAQRGVSACAGLSYSVSNAYRWAGGAENPAHLFRGQVGCLQRMGHLAGAWRYIIMLDAGKCCVAESSVGAGAAAAELPPEQCCIDGRAAQK